jgi:hypothetical protein
MKNLDLNKFGVVEMNSNEMIEISGGRSFLRSLYDGYAAGVGTVKIDEGSIGTFWYGVGYGLGVTVRQSVES